MDRKPTTEELVHLKQKFVADGKGTEDDFKKKAVELGWITQTSSDTYGTGKDNTSDIKNTFFSSDLSKDERNKAISDTKAKNAQYSLDALKKGDNDVINQMSNERTLLNGNGGVRQYKEVADYLNYHDLPDDKLKTAIDAMDKLISGSSSEYKKYQSLNKVISQSDRGYSEIGGFIKSINNSSKYTPEEKAQITTEMNKVRERYKKMGDEAKIRIKTLGDLPWYYKI